jgi:uncharacterized protein YbgA (DUF1722 family)/uncharacterized protein YbbK (DUF523 family)
MVPSPVVRVLKPFVDFRPVCPEVEIGLGVPRKPIRIVLVEGEQHLVQPETGKEVTAEMQGFVAGFLDSIGAVDGFVLKFRSPSCGIKDVKIYRSADKGAASSRGSGFFGGEVTRRFGGLAVEDEGRLKNFKIREHFLTKLYVLTDFRESSANLRMKDLVAFHTRNKFLLMAYSQSGMRRMGRIVANPEGKPPAEVFDEYRLELERALGGPPRTTSAINVLMHGLGFFSKGLASEEKAFFLDSLQDFRQSRVPLSVPVGILKSYVVRFDQEYLKQQTFFEPYPDRLISVTDSGKGRSL